MNETNWIQKVLSEYERPLVRYATRLVGDVDQARDIVQECFMRLCKQVRADVEPHVDRWLFTVVRNRALDVGKRESRLTSMTETQMERGSSRLDPALNLEQEDTAARVMRELETLPDNQSEVLRLKFQNGFAYKEIAEVTGLSVGNIGFLIHVGLKTLRERMASMRDETLGTNEVQS
ncbi:MAG: RNA polymerase sigma factor (sigma-70 family) [Planctomycetota bacterium]